MKPVGAGLPHPPPIYRLVLLSAIVTNFTRVADKSAVGAVNRPLHLPVTKKHLEKEK